MQIHSLPRGGALGANSSFSGTPTLRPLEIIIKTFLMPFNVFKPFYGLTFYTTKLRVLRTCGSPVFKVAVGQGSDIFW